MVGVRSEEKRGEGVVGEEVTVSVELGVCGRLGRIKGCFNSRGDVVI